MRAWRVVFAFSSGFFTVLLGYGTYILVIMALRNPIWPGLAYGFLAIVAASFSIFMLGMTLVAIARAGE